MDKRSFLRGSLWCFTALVMPSVLAGREYGGRGMPWQAGVADPPYPGPHPAQFFTAEERAIADAIVAHIIPSDETGPGADEAGVITFIEHQLAGYYGQGQRWYMQGPFPEPMETQGYQSEHPPAGLWREGLAALERYCLQRYEQGFAALPSETQVEILTAMEDDAVELDTVSAPMFFDFMREMTVEGFFCDPVYGGNRDMAGWRLVGFPGARYDYRDFLHHNGAAIDMPPVGLTGRPAWHSE